MTCYSSCCLGRVWLLRPILRHLHGLRLGSRHIQGLAAQGTHFQQSNFQMQAFVVGSTIVNVTFIVDFQGFD